MKKIVALILLLLLSLSMFSCGDKAVEDEEFLGYYQLGLAYSIPKSFELKNYNYGDLTYADGEGAYFFFSAFSPEEIEEDMKQNPDITVQEYTEIFKLMVAPLDTEYEYDSEKGMSDFEYVYEYDDEEDEYYRHVILRGSAYLYQITMSCYASDADKYEKAFDVIVSSISAY